MKILFHHRIGSKDGQAVHLDNLTTALRLLGHEVVIEGPSTIAEGSLGAESTSVALFKRFVPGSIYEILELAYSIIAFFKLRRAYLKHRPDVLYERYTLYLLAGVWLKRLYGVPMVLEVNSPLVMERSTYGQLRLKSLARWAERTVWRAADFVLPVTHVIGRMMKDAGVRDDRIVVIPNGVNPEFAAARDKREEMRRRLGLEGRTVLGFTGFIRAWHGLDTAIDFLADSGHELNLHLLVIGDGPARIPLEEQARARGVADRVRFLGIISREELAPYISAFDIALQPSVVPHASPLKIFEYMALGKAIVAPDTPNIREILVDGETALLFDPSEPAAFRASISRLCRDAAPRRRIGDAAGEEIWKRGFTWENNAARVVDLFNRLLAERSGSRRAAPDRRAAQSRSPS
jgi:glycosyltransferase involved in cell wall biosynthesis